MSQRRRPLLLRCLLTALLALGYCLPMALAAPALAAPIARLAQVDTESPVEAPAEPAPTEEPAPPPPAVGPQPPSAGITGRSVTLLSIFKPILMLLVLGGWAWLVSKFDKDLRRFHLMREAWNGIQLGLGVVAFGLWLALPWFWLGFLLAIVILVGGILGYHFYRTPRVPPERVWKLDPHTWIEAFEEKKEEAAQHAAPVKLIGTDGTPWDVPMGEDPQAPAHAQFEQMIDFALARRVERIELHAEASKTAVSVDIDGVRYSQPDLDPRLGLLLIDYLKGRAGLDVADRRRRQVGFVKVLVEEHGLHTLRLTTAGSTRGLSLTLDIDPRGRQNIPFDQMGLLDVQRQPLVAALDQEANKVVLVVAPAGQGVSTTLYALVGRHDPYTLSIITLEDEIVGELEGVNQDTIDPASDVATLNQRIKALMLRDTAVLMLSRLVDPTTARTIAESAHLSRFYVGLRQEDNLSALKVWIKAVGDGRLAANGLLALVAPRLIRQLCTTCRVPYKPDPEALRKLNLPADKVNQLYKSSGKLLEKDKEVPCHDCMGLGYKGRLGVYEVWVLDDEARKLIAAAEYDQLRAHLRKKRSLWIQEAALAKAVEGLTSVGEITRSLGGK